MKLSRTSLALAGAAALVAIGGVAYAGPPWTVVIGNNSSGDPANFTSSTVEINPATGNQPDFEWSVPAANLTCEDGIAEGSFTPGATASKIGEITGVSLTTCLGPFDIPWDFEQTAVWDINIVDDTSGVFVPVSVGNINYTMENPDGLCTFDVTGSVSGTLDMGSQQIHLDGGGTQVSNVSGCFGMMGSGNPHALTMTLQLNDIPRVLVAN